MTPPLAFTQAKYAAAMFGMSVKSVPGCLVAIAPSRIGVPVALAPGFGPHDDVLVETAALELVLELVVPLAAALLVVELLLLLLPQPARIAAPTTAARVRQSRVRGIRVRSSCILTISPPRVTSL